MSWESKWCCESCRCLIVFYIFASLLIYFKFRVVVVLVLISVLLFGCPAPTFFQFVMGIISVNGFVKQLKVKNMKNNIIRWKWASMGIRYKLINWQIKERNYYNCPWVRIPSPHIAEMKISAFLLCIYSLFIGLKSQMGLSWGEELFNGKSMM